jgi:hypothetical protein
MLAEVRELIQNGEYCDSDGAEKSTDTAPVPPSPDLSRGKWGGFLLIS